MENRLCFVQFLHPGGESQAPPSGDVAWNVGDHMRKYLDSWTLADIAPIARGDAPWPGEAG